MFGIASLAMSWFAFDGAVGEDGDASFALFVGAASILLMAWSFILAVRVSLLESLFGGLDRMYRIHRWCGTLAVVAMFLHTSLDPELEQGISGASGASEATADSAESLAGLVAAAERPARALGATTIEREDFDIRQGFGPDLSADIERVTSRITKRS